MRRTWHACCLCIDVEREVAMKKLWKIIPMIVLCAFAAGCGGASAPPVDLPAPVTGQIEIGTPTADGKSTITGSAGAVPGGSYVLVINERIEVAADTSPLIKLLDELVPSAYADTTLPDICALAGHWCVIAEDDGSFELIIDAYINDSIVIVIIDEWGTEISERLIRSVPASDHDIVACPDMSVSGKLKGLANPDGIPLGLYEGSDDASNTLVVTGTSSSESLTIPLPGCYAKGFTFLPYSDEGGRVVMISSDDKLMWIGAWGGEYLVYAQTFNLEGVPIGVTQIGEDNYVAVTFENGNGFTVAIISTSDGSTVASYDIPNPTVPANAQLTKLIAMRSVGPFVDGAFAIGLLTQTDELNSYLSLIDSSDLTDLGNIYLVPGTYFFEDLTDMEFAVGNNGLVYALIDNLGDGAVHVRGFSNGITALTLNASPGSAAPLDFDSTNSVEKDIGCSDATPRRIAVNYDSTNDAVAYAITGTSSIIKIYGFLTSASAGNSLFSVSGAASALDIATNSDTDNVAIGNGQIVDITDDVN